MWGLWWTIIRIPIKQPGFHGKYASCFFVRDSDDQIIPLIRWFRPYQPLVSLNKAGYETRLFLGGRGYEVDQPDPSGVADSPGTLELVERIRSALKSRGPDAVKLLTFRWSQNGWGRPLKCSEIRRSPVEVGSLCLRIENRPHETAFFQNTQNGWCYARCWVGWVMSTFQVVVWDFWTINSTKAISAMRGDEILPSWSVI